MCPPVRGDWLLGYLYRSSSAQLCVAGLQPVNVQDQRVINVDLSSVVSLTHPSCTSVHFYTCKKNVSTATRELDKNQNRPLPLVSI